MVNLSAEEIEKNYNLHIKIIDTYLPKERADKVKSMIDNLGDEYVLAPASSNVSYHGAYPGGYLVHVNSVVRFALQESNLYHKMGGKLDFSTEELVFSALFHDLGKVGLKDKPNYLPQDNDWFIKNRGECYKHNGDLDYMLIPDRSLFILQSYGISVDQQEFLAIKLHDGLFEESNKAYYISYNPDSMLKTHLVPILHVADYLSSKMELDTEIQTIS